MAANRKFFDTSLRYIRPQAPVLREIYAVGVPAVLMQALMSFMNYGVNIILGSLSASVVTAYGIYYKIQQFVFFAGFGMNNAMVPIIAYNFGRRDKKRVTSAVRCGMAYTLVLMAVGAVCLQVFAPQLIGIFAVSEASQRLCLRAIRIITFSYLFAGANIAFQGIFQAFGYGVHSLITSLLRLIVVTLPLAWVLTLLPQAEQTVWFAFPAAEVIAFAASLFMLARLRPRINAFMALPTQQNPQND